MGAEQVRAEVVPGIVPDGVDVVGVVLRIVQLDEQRRPVDAIVVGLAGLERARPGEVAIVVDGGGQTDRVGRTLDVHAHQHRLACLRWHEGSRRGTVGDMPIINRRQAAARSPVIDAEQRTVSSFR